MENLDFQHQCREALKNTRRIVVKLGSRVLVQRTGEPELKRLRSLVKALAVFRRAGREVVIVTSGAIGTGMSVLGLRRRPRQLPELQMAAAVGQCRLMTLYDKLFAAEGCRIGQVLLTHDDLKHRARHLNARNTMLTMIREGIVPVVNENDVVAVDEIRFGDNDLLASLVVLLIEADLLVLLSTVNGLHAPGPGGSARRVSFVPSVTKEILGFAQGKGSELSTGGMLSKLGAAQSVTRVGTPVVIADGREPGILEAVLRGDDVGTLVASAARESGGTLSGRQRWIAFFNKPQGTLVVDDGAREAVERKGKSLLPIGVKGVEGKFGVGAVVDVKTRNCELIARGLVEYDSEAIRKIMGHRTTDIAPILGACDNEEVIHRDNLVVLAVTEHRTPKRRSERPTSNRSAEP